MIETNSSLHSFYHLHNFVNTLCQHIFIHKRTGTINALIRYENFYWNRFTRFFTRSQMNFNESIHFFFLFFKYIFIIEYNTVLIRCEKLKIPWWKRIYEVETKLLFLRYSISENEAVTRTYVHGKLATFPDNSIVTSLIYTTRASAKSKLPPPSPPPIPFCSSYHRLYFIFPGFGYARAPIVCTRMGRLLYNRRGSRRLILHACKKKIRENGGEKYFVILRSTKFHDIILVGYNCPRHGLSR